MPSLKSSPQMTVPVSGAMDTTPFQGPKAAMVLLCLIATLGCGHTTSADLAVSDAVTSDTISVQFQVSGLAQPMDLSATATDQGVAPDASSEAGAGSGSFGEGVVVTCDVVVADRTSASLVAIVPTSNPENWRESCAEEGVQEGSGCIACMAVRSPTPQSCIATCRGEIPVTAWVSGDAIPLHIVFHTRVSANLSGKAPEMRSVLRERMSAASFSEVALDAITFSSGIDGSGCDGVGDHELALDDVELSEGDAGNGRWTEALFPVVTVDEADALGLRTCGVTTRVAVNIPLEESQAEEGKTVYLNRGPLMLSTLFCEEEDDCRE